jgi:diguanylate cyclase (GGDEF)-like protein
MKTILCVDDIETNLFTLEVLFESNFKDKYTILTAKSGQDALSILLKEKVDLILLDIMMPDLDGFGTIKLIQKNKKTKDIPVIFLTAKKDEETVSTCYELGGVDYMNKPFNSKELFSRVAFHLALVENKHALEKERDLIQGILDTQDNLLIVTDGTKISRTNSSVCKLFGVKDTQEFANKYTCICNTFIPKEGYFSLNSVDDKHFWIDTLLEELKIHNRVVQIKDIKTAKLHSYDIKIKKFDANYILSLTNITYIDSEKKEYAHQADYDSLTNIYNRKRLEELFEKQVEKSETLKETFCTVMIDIDHFKRVNDTYGHLVGDTVLITLSQLVNSNIRQSDIFARWGGEEFVLLLPNVKIDLAEKILTHLRIKIEDHDFADVEKITCSFGVTEYIKGDNIESMLKRADEALYVAKETGRNRVNIA